MHQSYLEAREDLFARSKAHPDVVMLGDSLTEMGIWAELVEGFSVINRGIGGNDSAGVLKQLPEVLQRKPRVICVEIGTNDLQNRIPPDRVVENVRAVAAAATQAGIVVILQAVPFVTATYRPNINEEVRTLNAALRQLSDGTQVRFFDLNAILADGDVLDPRNSHDGPHLNGRGYLNWTVALAPEVRNALQWCAATIVGKMLVLPALYLRVVAHRLLRKSPDSAP
jgi:lysophospholipase L1-like esterase